MKLVLLYQRLLVSEKRKEKMKASRKVPRYKGTFLFICYTLAINVYNIEKKKIIESPKFRQTLRFYKFILNILSNIRITSPRLIGYVGWGMD